MKKRRRKRRIRVIPCILILSIPIVIVIASKYVYEKIIVPKQYSDDWNLVLVDRTYAIPSDYEINLITLTNEQQVDERIYPYLQQMFDAARSEGLQLFVRSGYRSAADQEAVYEQYVNDYMQQGYTKQEAEAQADTYVAPVNHSEHQLGIAVDINADGDTPDEDVYAWLDAHAYTYGFIRRYPPDKVSITNVSNEPWHYRYVGKEAATIMKENNLCLEEYLQQYYPK